VPFVCTGDNMRCLCVKNKKYLLVNRIGPAAGLGGDWCDLFFHIIRIHPQRGERPWRLQLRGFRVCQMNALAECSSVCHTRERKQFSRGVFPSPSCISMLALQQGSSVLSAPPRMWPCRPRGAASGEYSLQQVRSPVTSPQCTRRPKPSTTTGQGLAWSPTHETEKKGVPFA
jgi:hypothetical protein